MRTWKEISIKYFSHRPNYCYKRMRQMRLAGLLSSRVGKVGDKTNVQYSITELGLSIVGGGKLPLPLNGQSRPKKKRNRAREWTVRDITLLEQLFRSRELTKQQVAVQFFEGSKNRAGARIHVLKIEGLLHAKVSWSRESKKLEAHYRISERGIRLLLDREIIEHGQARARDLVISEKQRSYITDANEIAFKCSPLTFLDSRMIKRKYSLNRGDLVLGAFSVSSGDYMIYILAKQAYKITIERIIKEIKSEKKDKSSIAGYFVFYKEHSTRDTFERLSKKLGIVTGGIPIYVLPFSDKGVWIIREFIFGDQLTKWLRIDGQIRPVVASKYHFKYGVILDNGTRKYAVETLTGDNMLLERILREYKGKTDNKERMDVLLFCWSEESDFYRKKVSGAHWMEVVPISWES